MAKTTDELFAEATEADYETAEPVTLAASDTEEEFQFRIDEHLRTIAIPEKGVVAGVEGDLNVNIARFTMTRYYHGRDLSKLNIRINYRNANGQVNYYTVSDATASGDSIIFSWEFAADVTQYKGNVQFVVYLFSATNAVLKQRFFTTLGTLEVLEGLEVDSSIPVSEQTDILLHLKKDLSAYAEEVKKSLPADYTAMTEQVSSLKEEIGDEMEVLKDMKLGTDEYKIAVDGVTKLYDRAIEIKKIEAEQELKRQQHEADQKFKEEQQRDERNDRMVKNGLTLAALLVTTGTAVWGTIKSIKFEETGTITTIMGRGWINKLIPKK